MLKRRVWWPLAILLVLAGCQDNVAGPQFSRIAPVSDPPPPPPHILTQAPTAPRLARYQVSFWARRGTQTTVSVNYRPAPGQSRSDPFLRFKIPINGLVAGAAGAPLERRDSVRITLTIDSVDFKLDFQPSGVVFSKSSPAQLAIWYQNANPDLNGDGVVNATDAALQQQVSIWSQSTTEAWRQLSSKNDPTQKLVAAEVFHFSGYAVSW